MAHNRECGIDITSGSALIERCDVERNFRCGVVVRNGATPLVARNRIHHDNDAGVLVLDSGAGSIIENDIFANRNAGLISRTGAHPFVYRNKINENRDGCLVLEAGGGVFEQNDVYVCFPSTVRLQLFAL